MYRCRTMGRVAHDPGSVSKLFLEAFRSGPAGREPYRNPLNCLARLLAALVCAVLVSASPPAAAHARINSYSHAVVMVNGDMVDYYLNLPPPVISLLHQNVDDEVDDLTDFFRSQFRITTIGKDCPLSKLEKSPPLKSGNMIVELRFLCPVDVTDLTIRSSLFLDEDESHTQFVRIAPPDDPRQVLHEAVLSESNMTFHLTDIRTRGSATLERAAAFLKLGIQHLLTGYDHILFLLTVVVGISFIESLKAVTSFTLAHSITMALAFLGEISLPSSIVEPLIAITVIYVSFENIIRANVRRRWVWTFFFGLIHGLGFVDALKLITISKSELVLSLLTFNIGIEIGQLVVLCVAVITLWYLRRFPWHAMFNRGFSAGVGLLGCIWLVQRLMVV